MTLRLGALFAVFALSTSIAQAVTIIHSNDVLGELETCGCRNNPQGGVARKYNLLNQLKGDTLLQLDAGDLLFPDATIAPLLQEQSLLQAEYVVEALNLLEHDAFVPGEKDFALGLKAFERLRKKAKFRFLAANLKKGGKPFLDAHAIFEKKTTGGKSLVIGVFGLVGDQLSWPKALRASSPIAAAKEQIKSLRKTADLIVALTHQGLEKDRELARKVPGIDLIIGSHTQSFLQTPIKEGQTWIYQSSFRNQYIGVIPLETPLKAESYRLIGLDAGYNSPANQLNPLDGLVARFKRSVAELATQREAQFTSKNRAETQASGFQTFPQCVECHQKQFEFWRHTLHANALQPLVEAKQAQNKECLSCHTVGLGQKGGFEDVTKLAESKGKSLTADELAPILKAIRTSGTHQDGANAASELKASWAPVQCENCHGAAGSHPFSGTYSKTVAKEVCLRCHTAERAPEWYTAGKPDWTKIKAKRSQVACPAGEDNL